MRTFINILLLAILLPPAVSAQEQPEDIILKAMQDELDRNMKELRLPNYDKPFFIMYNIQDQKTFAITSSLGSVVQSTEKPLRFKSNTRVLVGDYSFNDESLEDNLSSSPSALEIGLPLDNDYLGIRRSLWSSTDKVYRDAARHFLKHQQTLKESGKKLEDIPHRSFGKGKAVRLISTVVPHAFDKASWETTLKDLSSVFLRHPDILYSGVIMQYTEGHNYLVNSENVVAKIPFQKASVIVLAQQKNELGEFVFDQISHEAKTPDKLPSADQLRSEIESMISNISTQLALPKLEEEYNGPVLLEGRMVADIFSSAMFNGTESIIANNFVPRLTGYQYSANSVGMDNKVGKNILSETVTIKAKPGLKTYNGVELSGAFQIDDEGIVPPDELIIVENGTLKSLLNDRTITHASQIANGFSSGPGVLEISTGFKHSKQELKNRLISAAKAEGLEYGIMIKRSPTLMGIVEVYKVFVANGKEEVFRNAMMPEVNFKSIRRILAASGVLQAYNLNTSKFLNAGDNGPEMSLIVPEAILFESLDIRPFDVPTLKEEDYVSNPLLEIK